jgi:hypothetical protein
VSGGSAKLSDDDGVLYTFSLFSLILTTSSTIELLFEIRVY